MSGGRRLASLVLRDLYAEGARRLTLNADPGTPVKVAAPAPVHEPGRCSLAAGALSPGAHTAARIVS